MGDQTRLQTVALKLRPNEQYFIGGMLMLRERLLGCIQAINAHPLEKVKSAIAKAHRAKTRRLRSVFAL